MKAVERLPRNCRSGGTEAGNAEGITGEEVTLTSYAKVYRDSSSGKQAVQSIKSWRALKADIRWKTVPSHSGFFVLWQTSASRPSSLKQPAALAHSTRGNQVSVGARVVLAG